MNDMFAITARGSCMHVTPTIEKPLLNFTTWRYCLQNDSAPRNYCYTSLATVPQVGKCFLRSAKYYITTVH